MARLQQEIDAHLQSDHPSEDFIISKITNIASQLYIEANSTEMVTALIARKRAMLMRPQDFFNPDYFSDLVETISLGESGQIKIHTKTNTIISEEVPDNGSYENPEEENFSN